jgi:hypothetical protein
MLKKAKKRLLTRAAQKLTCVVATSYLSRDRKGAVAEMTPSASS